MTELPDGWYWTNFRGEVAPRLICDGKVIVGVVPFKASEVDEIGPPCNRDDAEQLVKARKVLSHLNAVAEDFAESGLARYGRIIADIIEESGVRL